MPLKLYRQKRSFDKTSEPKPKIKKTAAKSLPIFCIQKHAASHLHYDFRLEYKGVLLSWAIPKGPSMNPSQKRLAIRVEDHPYDYHDFEGVIPPHNYGAGTVMLWDAGTFTSHDAAIKKEIEKNITQGFVKGVIEIELFGKKLRGKFVLTKLKNAEDDDKWLFFKKNDSHANVTEDIVLQDLSVQTHRSMEEISKG